MSFLFKNYFNQKSRAIYSHVEFRKYFGNQVLDVGAGGSPAYFRPLLGSSYKSVDVSDNRHQPDFFVDLEKGKLPFDSNQFETVLCFDNLEHCENCHELFDELIRVSSKYVIVSLPNNWPPVIKNFFYGRNKTHRLGYGLPAQKPDPGVRHKWYFNLEEAEHFLTERAKMSGCQVKEVKYVFHEGSHLLYVPLFYPLLFRAEKNHLIRFLELDEKDQVKFGKKAQILQKLIQFFGLNFCNFILQTTKLLSLPFWLVDELIKQTIWGWGSQYRYLNMFCRQIWVVIEKRK